MGNREKKDSSSMPEVTHPDIILAVFSGLVEEDGGFKVLPGIEQFPESAIYSAFKQLAQEFPQDFGWLNFESLIGGPYSPEIETTLFNLGSSGVIMYTDYQRKVELWPEKKRAISKVLERHYGKENFEHFSVLSQRFREIVEQFSTSAISVK